ncbi:hypothetical protein OUZ56_004013 [Daphnia magna]|uniref:Uncharacterized protein n=1 Tax=Daphnia magna TaxID=35525 RepID=A0ABQ9YNI4_9CRUS|nr:hypothetical protein OUZ56_004013 [Daphnia magna]
MAKENPPDVPQLLTVCDICSMVEDIAGKRDSCHLELIHHPASKHSIEFFIHIHPVIIFLILVLAF